MCVCVCVMVVEVGQVVVAAREHVVDMAPCLYYIPLVIILYGLYTLVSFCVCVCVCVYV